MPRLNIVIGSTRPGRAGGQVGAWFAQTAREHAGFDVHVVDLAELALPFLDEPAAAIDGEPYQHEHTRRWSELTAAAEAFVIVTPEYNQGYPASLKNALDYLYAEWLDKPVAFVSYGMTSGGMRAVQQLKPVVSALGMVPVNATVVVHLRQTIDSTGTFTPTPAMRQAAHHTLDELLRLTAPLATLRAAALPAAAH
jgi:NAD(P)H-dependent FMN reductase